MNVSDKEVKYWPFGNGDDFDIWHSRNCQQCQLYTFHDSPTCKGDEGLTLALLGDGVITSEICDFIGTTIREIQDEGTPNAIGICTLNRDCNHFIPKHYDTTF